MVAMTLMLIPALLRPFQLSSIRALATMQRPRNRQPRPPRQGHDASRPRNDHSRRNVEYSAVPNVSQVRPGASVSIVLKQDQPTGHQVQGIVQDVLTSGKHPRGIKVRLTDGRVGRVQQMASQAEEDLASATTGRHVPRTTATSSYIVDSLPSRGLADFLPAETAAPEISEMKDKTVSVCPVCNEFRGDEIAVSRHVEEHFT